MELEYGSSSRYFTRVNNDYELLMDLEAGTKYYVYYYHVNSPFTLEILYQYAGQEFRPDLKLPDMLQTIDDEAFSGSAFTKVEIPESVTYVGPSAFAGCGNLEIILFRGAETEIADGAFDEGAEIMIIAPENSKAEEYAREKGIEFHALGE